MSKTIKLEDQVYNRLEELRGKRETFSQAVERRCYQDEVSTVCNCNEGNRTTARCSYQRLSR